MTTTDTTNTTAGTSDAQSAEAARAARPRRALILVDIQPTFCEGGELPVTGGNAVAEASAAFLLQHRDDYELVVTTQDWHVDPGHHFSAAPDFVDSWPAHGVAGSANAAVHPAVTAALAAGHGPLEEVRKGAYAAAYSGFDGTDTDGTPLGRLLDRHGITDVDVAGIAESHCVLATVLDARRAQLGVRVLSDLTVPVTEELGRAARQQMLDAGAQALLSTDAFTDTPTLERTR